MSVERFSMSFEITTNPGPLLQPTALKVTSSNSGANTSKAKKDSSSSFVTKSSTDTSPNLESIAHFLVGLSFNKLEAFMNPPQANSSALAPFANVAWKSLDPHFEIYWKTQNSLRELMDQSATIAADRVQELEKSLDTIIEKSLTPWGLDFRELIAFLDRIDGFEQRTKAPLLYNFGLKFSMNFVERLHTLYSLLFHVRCLIASHHNHLARGSAFQSLRIDSLSDYLPSAEYVANDAALYLQFKKQCRPFIGHKVSDSRIEKLLVEPLQKAFENWTHNACHLVGNIPINLLQNLKSVGIENELYRIQMDWLLGAPAGLLFRVREELYGLSHGYDQIFWPDSSENSPFAAESLNYSFSLGEHELFGYKSTVA